MGTHRVRVTKPSEESGKETELEWERMRKQLEQENPGTLQERKKQISICSCQTTGGCVSG